MHIVWPSAGNINYREVESVLTSENITTIFSLSFENTSYFKRIIFQSMNYIILRENIIAIIIRIIKTRMYGQMNRMNVNQIKKNKSVYTNKMSCVYMCMCVRGVCSLHYSCRAYYWRWHWRSGVVARSGRWTPCSSIVTMRRPERERKSKRETENFSVQKTTGSILAEDFEDFLFSLFSRLRYISTFFFFSSTNVDFIASSCFRLYDGKLRLENVCSLFGSCGAREEKKSIANENSIRISRSR